MRAVGREAVHRQAEHPLRLAELGVHRVQRLDPRRRARGTGSTSRCGRTGEVQLAGGRPLRLEDRLVRRRRRRARAAPGRPAASSAASHRSLPCQGMCGWSQLSQASRAPSGESARVGEEVVAARQHRLVAGSEGDGDERVDRLAAAPSGPRAPRSGGRARHRARRRHSAAAPPRVTGRGASPRAHAPDPLVGVVAEEDLAVGGDDEGAAAVLVHAVADVEGRGVDVGAAAGAHRTRRRRCGRPRSAGLRWQKIEPPAIAIWPKRTRRGGEQLGRRARTPAAEGRAPASPSVHHHRADRLAALHQLEALVDVLELQPVRDQVVDR